MDEQQIGYYRKLLEEKRRELQAALSSHSDETDPVSPDRALGRLTRQDAMLSQQMALEIRRRKQQQLTQVETALHRIEKGTYGLCVRCEEEISGARLKVRPEAPLCIHCAENRSRS